MLASNGFFITGGVEKGLVKVGKSQLMKTSKARSAAEVPVVQRDERFFCVLLLCLRVVIIEIIGVQNRYVTFST